MATTKTKIDISEGHTGVSYGSNPATLKEKKQKAEDSDRNRVPGLKCPDCGRPIFNDDVFCPHCGVNLDELIGQHAEEKPVDQPHRGRPLLAGLGFLLILAGLVLFVSALSHFPSNYWGQGVEVRWYKIDGLETVNGQVQYRLGPVQPEIGDPTNEELTQLANDWDPAFIAASETNQNIYLDRLPGTKGADFRRYLLGKLSGDVDMKFYSSLVGYKVLPSLRPRNGFIAAGVLVLLGLTFLLFGRRKTAL